MVCVRHTAPSSSSVVFLLTPLHLFAAAPGGCSHSKTFCCSRGASVHSRVLFRRVLPLHVVSLGRPVVRTLMTRHTRMPVRCQP